MATSSLHGVGEPGHRDVDPGGHHGVEVAEPAVQHRADPTVEIADGHLDGLRDRVADAGLEGEPRLAEARLHLGVEVGHHPIDVRLDGDADRRVEVALDGADPAVDLAETDLEGSDGRFDGGGDEGADAGVELAAQLVAERSRRRGHLGPHPIGEVDQPTLDLGVGDLRHLGPHPGHGGLDTSRHLLPDALVQLEEALLVGRAQLHAGVVDGLGHLGEQLLAHGRGALVDDVGDPADRPVEALGDPRLQPLAELVEAGIELGTTTAHRTSGDLELGEASLQVGDAHEPPLGALEAGAELAQAEHLVAELGHVDRSPLGVVERLPELLHPIERAPQRVEPSIESGELRPHVGDRRQPPLEIVEGRRPGRRRRPRCGRCGPAGPRPTRAAGPAPCRAG